MPNHHDTVIAGAQKAHGTISSNYVTDASVNVAGLQLGLGRLVKTGTVRVTPASAGAGLVTLTTTTVAHNLGYAPLATAALNNSQINGVGAFNLPLPTWLATTVDGTGNGILFTQYVSHSTDSVNFYIQTLIANGSNSGFFVTYYLYQQSATS